MSKKESRELSLIRYSFRVYSCHFLITGTQELTQAQEAVIRMDAGTAKARTRPGTDIEMSRKKGSAAR
jgi:hypothetical protein